MMMTGKEFWINLLHESIELITTVGRAIDNWLKKRRAKRRQAANVANT